jgi:cell division protein FtsB
LYPRNGVSDDKHPLASKRRTPASGAGLRVRRVVWLLLMFVASVVMVDALVGERGLLAMLRTRHQHQELAAAVARQRAENARLREQVRRLTEDPATIEEIARRELGLIRPGETLFIIKDLPPPGEAGSESR